ncbi:MAG: hypothetical protein ABL959_11390 [Pyrinomonadaceae bacterium]
MKRCPECRRDYYDDTLLYCLDDGNALLEGPASGSRAGDEPATAILDITASPNEAATRAQISTAEQTAVFRSEGGDAPKRGFDKRLLAVPILLIIVGGVVFGVYKLFIWRGTTGGLSNAANMKITRVTATGKANRAAISPDGNYIVHSMDDAGKQSLWIRQTATGSNVQILAPAAVNYWGITFSRDGNYIYFVSRDVGAGTGTLARIPVLGGAPSTLITDVDSAVTFSPDGQQFAFFRWNQRREENTGLWIANSDGTGERRLAFRTRPEGLLGAPAWSPDGKVIACAVGGLEPTGGYITVVAISVADGVEKPFTSQRWSMLGASNGRLGWVGTNSLVMNAPEQGSGDNAQLWQISYPGGQTQRLTRDLNDYDDVSLTRDGSSLVTVQSDRQTNLWLAPEGDARQARQLTFGKGSEGEGLCWTPDNRIVYVSQVSGNQEIWIMSAAGGDQKQLTNDPQADILPAVSPDGRYIVFLSGRSGTLSLWRMNMDGSGAKQLSGKEARIFQPLIGTDSRSVIFRAEDNNTWKVPIEGGEPEPAKAGDVDGRWAGLGYTAKDADGISRRNLTIWQGGEPQRFEIPQTVANIFPRFRSDGRAVYYVDAPTGVSNIWSFPLDGGQPKQVTNFQSEQIFAFAYSPDGKQIAVTRGSQTNDVVLLRDFR